MEDLGRGRRRSKGKAGSPSGLHPLKLDGGGLTSFNKDSFAGVYVVENEQPRDSKGRERLLVDQQAGTPGKKGSRGARNCSRSPWSCSVCTLDNRAENDECEACLSPRIGDAEKMSEGGESKSPYGQNDSEAGPSSVPASGGPEWACTLCTFANRFEAMECEACSQRRPFEAPAADSKANPDAQNAQRNLVELELLGRQDAPADADGSKEVDVTEAGARGESSELAVETERLAKEVEGAAGEAQQAAHQLEHNLLQELAGPSNLRQCEICSSTQTVDTFSLDGCSHRFCTTCLKKAVHEQVASLPPAESAELQHVFEACVCPSSECKTPLTQRDLILLTGEDQARSHQQWLYQVLTRAYGQGEAKSKCASCGEEQLARVKVSQLGKLPLRDVRRALKSRGLDASGKQPECVKRLQAIFSVGASGAVLEQWLCVSCPERNCVTCGAGLRAPGHDCKKAECAQAHLAVAELDTAFKAYVVSTDSSSHAKPSKKQKTSKSGGVWAAGTGYGGASDHMHHYAYWGGKHGKKKPPERPPESAAENKAKLAERDADRRLEKAMDGLISCLSGGPGDGLVSGLSLPLVALVHGSGTPARVLRALLLNDSMIDVSNRGALYLKALQLMRVLGARAELLPVICESPPKPSKEAPKPALTPEKKAEAVPAPVDAKGPARRSGWRAGSADKKGKRKVEEIEDDVICLGPGEKPGPSEVEEPEDEVEGTVLDAMEKLYKQASVVKLSLMGGLTNEGGSDELDVGLVCEICDAFEELQRAKKGWEEARVALRGAQGSGVLAATERAPESDQGLADQGLAEDDDEDCVIVDRKRRRGKKAPVPILTPADELKARAAEEAAYKKALKDLQFRIELLVNVAGKPDHYFRDKKNAIDNGGVHSQKRMLAISKEIGSLVTTLPLEWGSSVHVRVDEERMDLVKALIIGPGGTPYQNGAFLFDILLPLDYPQVSPKVQFMTTGGGRTRFNPNLYADGKVCLSILGTWSGPGWQPGRSTLMQVLLSIQGMIFVPEPYFNEPGYEAQGNKTASYNYSRNQRRNTLQLAVLGMLKHPPAVFADVIRTHFRRKRREIEAQCEAWAKEDYGPTPAPKTKAKKAKTSKKVPKFLGSEDDDSEDEATFDYHGFGSAMGGVNMDYESGRGSPIRTTMKEILVEIGEL